MAAVFHVGDAVVVTEDIDYHYPENSGHADCRLHEGLQGRVVQISPEGHILVRFAEPLYDRWVLHDDVKSLTAVVDTEKAPYADQGDSAPDPLPPDDPLPEPVTPAPRLSNPAQFVPVVFLSCTIVFLYCVYVFCHCLPLMQLKEQPDMVDHDARLRGIVSLVVFSVVTLLLVVSYLRAVLTHPGMIPGDDPHWQYHTDPEKATKYDPQYLKETKKSAASPQRRHCKWCHKFKPDRAHHCKVCGTCILKMDHHCPWIYNCVGYHNYKFFFLVIFYAVIALHMIFWTMFESVERSIEDDREPFLIAFLTLFGVTLAASLGFIVSPFLLFHTWLIFKGLSTIEFCEKEERRDDATLGELICGDAYRSKFDHGAVQNVRGALGDWTILWLLPVCPPSGNGLNFTQAGGATAEARSLEARRGMYYVRRTGHKKRARHSHRDHWV